MNLRPRAVWDGAKFRTTLSEISRTKISREENENSEATSSDVVCPTGVRVLASVLCWAFLKDKKNKKAFTLEMRGVLDQALQTFPVLQQNHKFDQKHNRGERMRA